MPFVVNGSPEMQVGECGGKFYTFKPGEMKMIADESVAFFLESKCYWQGFRTLPKQFEEDLDFRSTDAGKAIVADRCAEGLKSYKERLKQIVLNVEESLAKDLSSANIKTDPWDHASDGEIAALKKLEKLEKADKEAQKARTQDARKVLDSLNLKG